MTAPKTFHGRLGLQQRVLPDYRAPFFEQLAASCRDGFSLIAGQPRPVEAIQTADRLEVGELARTENRHILRGSLYLCRQPGLIPWLEDWRPDALVVEANPRYLTNYQAIRWMHAKNRPVLGWGLGAPALSGPMAGVQERARRGLLNRLDGIIAYSRRGAAEYRTLGMPEERVFVAHNAAAHRPSGPPPARSAGFERGQVLFVGRLQVRKRLEMLFRACASLPEEVQPGLVIVGDGPAREAFEAQAAALYPQAEFVGARHGEELRLYYAAADLFVLPGTGGLAVQQALAHGLAVIVAQGDGTQEDLVRPQNGWLIEPGSQPSLNAALKDALSDPARLRRMGDESYRIARDEINLEAMADQFVHALNRITALGLR